MAFLDDVLSTVNGTVSTVADAYVKLNQAAAQNGLASQSRTIDELKGTVSLLQQQAALQAAALQEKAQQSSVLDSSAVKWALVAGGLFIAYKLLK